MRFKRYKSEIHNSCSSILFVSCLLLAVGCYFLLKKNYIVILYSMLSIFILTFMAFSSLCSYVRTTNGKLTDEIVFTEEEVTLFQNGTKVMSMNWNEVIQVQKKPGFRSSPRLIIKSRNGTEIWFTTNEQIEGFVYSHISKIKKDQD